MTNVNNHGYAYKFASNYCSSLEFFYGATQSVVCSLGNVMFHPVETAKNVSGWNNFAQIPHAWKEKDTIIMIQEKQKTKIEKTIAIYEYTKKGKCIETKKTETEEGEESQPITQRLVIADKRKFADRVGLTLGQIILGSRNAAITAAYVYGTAANLFAPAPAPSTNELAEASKILAAGVNGFIRLNYTIIKDVLYPVGSEILKAAVNHPDTFAALGLSYLACKEFTKAANPKATTSDKIIHGISTVALVAMGVAAKTINTLK